MNTDESVMRFNSDLKSYRCATSRGEADSAIIRMIKSARTLDDWFRVFNLPDLKADLRREAGKKILQASSAFDECREVFYSAREHNDFALMKKAILRTADLADTFDEWRWIKSHAGRTSDLYKKAHQKLTELKKAESGS